MKVTPSNQTLILASERGARGGNSGVGVAQTPGSASSAAVLQRVTMVTALPDSTLVYLRADYARQSDVVPDNVVATQPKAAPPQSKAPTRDYDVSDGSKDPVTGNAIVASPRPFAAGLARLSGASAKDAFGNPQLLSQGGLSSQLRPEEQYAQTQRILGEVPYRAHLDVHA